MAHSYIPVDRDQLFLLPPDVRDWLPPGHLAWFVIEVVATVDTSALHARHPNDGVGRRAFDPDMMLALLIYSYCVGQRSSRKIEQLCEVDSAYRVLCANQIPDHSTIARFRTDHGDAMAGLFVDVLVLCRQAGLAAVGQVALDGTKMAGQASLNANRGRDAIEAKVKAMMAEAETVDAEQQDLFGDSRGDELPAGLDRHGAARLARLKECLTQIDAEEAAARAADAATEAAADAAAAVGKRRRGRKPKRSDPVADAERDLLRAKVQAEQRRARRAKTEAAAAAKGRRPHGPAPDYETKIRAAEAARDAARDAALVPRRAGLGRRNMTDPESRLMKTAKGWLQGFNTQAVVNEHQIVLAAQVSQDHTDMQQFEPMIDTTTKNLAAAGITEPVGIVLADAGYCSDNNLTSPGPDRLIATARRHKQELLVRDQGLTHGPPPAVLSPLEQMKHRLRTSEGRALYARRSAIVEPVFGQIKTNRNCDRFSHNGLQRVTAEWHLITACHNLLKIFTHTTNTQPTQPAQPA